MSTSENTFVLNEDWAVVKFLQWFGSFLGASSPYDFQSQKTSTKFYTYYSIGLILLTVFGSLYAFVERNLYVYTCLNLTTVTMDTLSLFVATTFILIVISTSLCTMKTAEALFTSLIKNDMFLHKKQNVEEKSRFEMGFRARFGLANFLFVFIVIYDSYVRLKHLEVWQFRCYIFKNFQYYVFIYISFKFCEFIKLILKKIKFSTQILFSLVDEMYKFPKDFDTSGEEPVADKWTRVSQKIKPREEDVMQLNLLIKIFDVLLNSTNEVNAIFEYPLLFLVFSNIIEAFQLINFLIAFASKSLVNDKFANFDFVCVRLIWFLLLLGLTINVIKESENFQSSIKGITIKLHKKILETPFDNLLRDEAQDTLVMLHQQFMHRSFHISAVFFQLNFAFVADIFVLLTSCVPIMVQFNRL
ncbi:hypothetical protein FQA39_LY13245 [Lamprigera yunnana]|nr:hypothetical protein FQA39_LY13245 [Lamprigera yunnana]